MMLRLAAMTALLFCLVGCRSVPPHVDALYGRNSLLVQNGSVTAFRIHTKHKNKPESRAIHGHEIEDQVNLTHREARPLRKILLSPRAFLWTPPKRVKLCTFEPAVAFRFENGPERLTVLYSFVCGRMKLYHGGKLLGMKDADPALKRLLKFSRKHFPDDTYLRLMPDPD